MIRPELLKMLVCPETRDPLSVASDALLARLNQAIAAGKLVNRGGQKLERKLDGGLVRSDQAVVYAIVDDIPMMLVDEGILLSQPALQS
jgi:uncharacterized protein YbaR (Trm112 family)